MNAGGEIARRSDKTERALVDLRLGGPVAAVWQQIWFRARDLLPIRVTVHSEQFISKKFIVRIEATVDYAASPR